MTGRLPAHLEVSGLVRAANTAGGFASVLHKGEREAGTILIVLTEKGANARVYERMPSVEGDRVWTLSKREDADNKQEIEEYLQKRVKQDDDLWILELDIADGERLIGLTGRFG